MNSSQEPNKTPHSPKVPSAEYHSVDESVEKKMIETPSPSTTTYHALDDQAETALSIGIKRTCLLMGTFTAGVVVAFLSVYFHRGVTLFSFEASEKDERTRSKLLDDYNSYSANVVSVFGRPIEIIVGLVVQVIILRFATGAILQTENKRSVYVGVLFLVAALEYLVLNGFNALNVQLRSEPVHPVISISDLSIAATANNSVVNATNASITFSEASTKNPITNTVLRNLVVPRATRPGPDTRKCTSKYPYSIRPDLVDFGFPSRTWHQDMLPEALDLKMIRVPLDKKTSVATVAKQLPMSSSIASTLFVNTAWIASQHFMWFSTILYNLEQMGKEGETDYNSVVNLMNLRPNKTVHDNAENEWLLENARDFLHRSDFSGHGSIPGKLAKFEFSHVDVSSSIVFDAMTLEVEIDVSNVTGKMAAENGANYTRFSTKAQCGPWPGVCFFNVPRYSSDSYDKSAMIEAYSTCLNTAKGDEEPYFQLDTSASDVKVDCNKTSDSSMLVAVVGKRLVADTLFELVDETISGPHNATAMQSAVTNLRKIYTITVGRLSWKTTDLAKKFNADCDVNEQNGCLGLSYDLDGKNQTLVASADQLPLKQLNPLSTGRVVSSRPLALVDIIEPYAQEDEEGIIFGPKSGNDVLLPHNMETEKWNKDHVLNGSECNEWVEDRLSTILDNHFYIEYGLQPAYTAAMFFLFQDGTVRDVIPLPNELQSLSFDKNIKKISVLLSTPQQNVILTLTGVTLLCLGALSVALYSRYLESRSEEADPWTKITTPHVIAQVLLNEAKFPPSVLHRRMINRHESDGFQEKMDGSIFDSVTLRSENSNRRIEIRQTDGQVV